MTKVWTEHDGTTWEECKERVTDDMCVDVTPSRADLASNCTAPTLVTVSVQVIEVKINLPAQIRFDDLMAAPAVMRELKSRVTDSFASAANVPPEYVTVTFQRTTSRRLDARKTSLRRLQAGGVQATAEIVAPAESSLEAVSESVAATGGAGLAESIVTAVIQTPNIGAAAPDLQGLTPDQLENLRDDMEGTTTGFTQQTTSTTMTLEAGSPLATAAQSNPATTTTTNLPTTSGGGPGATTASSSTTASRLEGDASGSRGLVAMTITTAAAAALVSVSA